MKKSIAVIAVVLIVAVAVAAAFLGSSPFEKKETEPQTSAQTNQSAEVEVNRLSSAPYSDVEDICKHSTNIVKAALVSSEKFNYYLNESVFRVIEDYTDNTPEEIYVYDKADERLILGKEYYLFLQSGESALYPHPVFSSTIKGTVLAVGENGIETVENGKVEINPSEVEKIAKNALKKGIVGSALGKRLEVSSSTDKSVLADESDVIAEIKVSHEAAQNKYVALYQVDDFRVADAKDSKSKDLGKLDYILLPPGLKADTVYYAFMKFDPDGGLVPFSRAYPVIEKSESNLEDYITDK